MYTTPTDDIKNGVQLLRDNTTFIQKETIAELLDMGIYVIGFFFPVVPKGEARIRVQLSASHSTNEHIDKAVNAFIKVGKKLKVI